jgi:hypothetical protein
MMVDPTPNTANLNAHVGEQLKREAADAMDAIFAGEA